ncbi:lanthionine synthetase LanC family protein [Embleya sp. AB8]|uniref:lanthionine synthetase LanC family protein n=1 Tax=Embleya sp. AB8 TaxID=3156304 RepID=UPI003C7250CB
MTGESPVSARPGGGSGARLLDDVGVPAPAGPLEATSADFVDRARDIPEARGFARTFLRTYARSGRSGAPRAEPGPVVLAVLLARARSTTDEDTLLARAAVRRWAQDVLARDVEQLGLHDGGLAGMLVGLRLGATLHPPLATVAERVRGQLGARCAREPWRVADVGFADYDVVSGPAGVLLGLGVGMGMGVGAGGRIADDGAGSAAERAPVVRHLAGLCSGPGLGRLRIAEFCGQPWPARFMGRVNLGLAHGAPGVLLALASAARAAGAADHELHEPLAATAAWLAARGGRDANGCPTWGPVAGGADGSSGGQRQGWCYGTPGVTWALWEAARVLGDAALRRCAEDTFAALAEQFDVDRHLFGPTAADRLGVCHGAAGVLAIADAFARHAGLPAAVGLRTRLTAHLRAESAATSAPATGADATLLGLLGTHAVLLTAETGYRNWLPCLGLR